MPYFDNLGAQLYYEETGNGYPLIFLHGASWDMRQWERECQYFSKKYRVITLDARGHGKSSLPPGKVDSDIFWRDAVALMDFLDISKGIICGLSMGGHVAIQMAANAKERIEGIILIGAVCTNSFNRYERFLLPINRFSLHMMPMSFIARSMGLVLGKSDPEVKAYILDVVGGLDHNAFNRVWKAVTRMESRDKLSQISCPALILIGDRDTMTRRQQTYIHEHISGSRLVTINNAHHSTNLDNPEQVQLEIDAFLQELRNTVLV